MSSLRSLTIYACYKFKSFSEGVGCLTCLEYLEIIGFLQLIFPSNMNRLTALREVRVVASDENSKLPEGLEHIPSLQSLTLIGFSSLTSLPDWLGAMTSQRLGISSCPELRSLPDSFQQLRNLHELRIRGCPKLEKRCKEGIGEDWQKIAHIPEFEFVTYTKPTFCGNLTNPSLF